MGLSAAQAELDDARAETGEDPLRLVARHCGILSVECSDVAGYVEGVAARTRQHLETLDQLENVTTELLYDQGEVALTPGDNLLLYTDGIVEARSASGEEFGEDRLIEAMRLATGLGAAVFTQSVIELARNFTGGHFEDDLTVVGISIHTLQRQGER